MAQIPGNSVVQWTGGGVFVTTELIEDGPDPESEQKFIASEKQVFLDYMADLWEKARNRDGNGTD